MDADEDDGFWVIVASSSESASKAADAAQRSLSRKHLRQALKSTCESVQWYSRGVFAKLNVGLKDDLSIQNVIHRPLDAEISGKIAESLAHEDAQASAAQSAHHQVQGAAEHGELEQYSHSMTEALHIIFHQSAVLPCNCQHKDGKYHMLDNHACALRLDAEWKPSGDDDYCFFDSVVATDDEYRWVHIQFQVPRIIRRARIAGSACDSNAISNDDPLGDFCRIIEYRRCHHYVPIRIRGSLLDQSHQVFELDPEFLDDFPKDQPPTPLSEILSQNLLSTKSKIQLAFTLAKYFWQFYESEWMRAAWNAWNFETLHLLPQGSDPAARSPFLSLRAMTPERCSYSEYEPLDPSSGRRRMHRYPYILNLCLLLVLLCTDSDSAPKSDDNVDEIYCFCAKQIKSQQAVWPAIDLESEHRRKYRMIVAHCLPDPCKEVCLDVAERRVMLRDNVVRPLYDLLQDMRGRYVDDVVDTRLVSPRTNPQNDTVMEKVMQTPSIESRNWIDSIVKSTLQCHISDTLKNTKGKKRPKVAIIDTGYDSKSSWLKNMSKLRLGQSGTLVKNYKDFWGGESEPRDDAGHGTSMLYTVMRIAPFADVCVARIASDSTDLREESSITSKNLEKAILWAVEVQNADIISLSFGWEEEQLCDGRLVVSNAISEALSKRNQELLIFAAASNYGGGREELFPATHPQVCSIRATNALGRDPGFNPPLPKTGAAVFGTLGVGVPTKGKTHAEVGTTGTSVATAITAGIAAVIIGYINLFGEDGSWDKIRTQHGFEKLLHNGISTEPEARKRFITLEKLFGEHWQKKLEARLTQAAS